MSVNENLRKLLKQHEMRQEDLAKRLNVSQSTVSDWINKGTARGSNLKRLADFFHVTIDDLVNGTVTSLQRVPVKQIPLISWVQAGMWSEMQEQEYDEYIPVDVSVPKNCFALRIQGDSMTSQNGGRTIPDGSVVIVEPYNGMIEDLNHKVVIAADNEKATIKELVIDGQEIYLKPWNSQYKMLSVTQSTRIVGRVIRCQISL